MDREIAADPGSFQARGLALIELQKLRNLCYPLQAIHTLGVPVGETAPAIACQVSYRTARRWLTRLEQLGYITRQGRFNGYAISPLTAAKMGALFPNERNFLPDERNILPDERNFLPLEVPTTTTTNNNEQLIDQREVSVVVDHNDRKKLPVNRNNFPVSDEVLSTLRACGIGEPKRSALARLSWVTPDFINKLIHRKKQLTQYARQFYIPPSTLVFVKCPGSPIPPDPHLGKWSSGK
jgi:hypothetical protein